MTTALLKQAGPTVVGLATLWAVLMGCRLFHEACRWALCAWLVRARGR